MDFHIAINENVNLINSHKIFMEIIMLFLYHSQFTMLFPLFRRVTKSKHFTRRSKYSCLFSFYYNCWGLCFRQYFKIKFGSELWKEHYGLKAPSRDLQVRNVHEAYFHISIYIVFIGDKFWKMSLYILIRLVFFLSVFHL